MDPLTTRRIALAIEYADTEATPEERAALMQELIQLHRYLLIQPSEGNPTGRDWTLVYSPPPGFDVGWLEDHPEWLAV